MWSKKILEKQKKKIQKLGIYRVPPHLARNHKEISQQDLDKLAELIRNNYYSSGRNINTISKELLEKEMNDNLFVRLTMARFRIVPWLDDAKPLSGSKILEIGCGTGTATVALAEQGAEVTGIDLSESSLEIARQRCKLYGVTAEFRNLNVTEMKSVFADKHFDFIIFFASLEHMLISERIEALKTAWEVLALGSLLVIVDTPNRLWYFDGHTSLLPFFHWLPDELAFYYSRFSERENFKELYREINKTSMEHFLRQGRGVSFHEFEVAIKPANQLKVISSLYAFEKRVYKTRHSRKGEEYKTLLHSLKPDIHGGFFDKSLDLIIEKN